MEENMENWKACEQMPGFEISDLGNLKRVAPYNKTKFDYGGVTPSIGGRGYLYAVTTIEGKRVNLLMHRLVMRAFVGPSNLQVNHKNGNKTDNRLCNLEYCTGSENLCHARDVLGTFAVGEDHYNAKLKKSDILEIFLLHRSNVPKSQIAGMLEVSEATIRDVLKRKTWRHVEVPPHLLPD